MTDQKRASSLPPEQSGVMGEIQSEVAVEAAPFLRFIIKHSKAIVFLVLLLIAAIIATGVMQWQKSSKQAKAEIELGSILAGASQGAERISRLEAFIANAPSTLQQGALLELALVAQKDGNHQRAAEAFAQAAQLGGDSPLAIMARINQADALVQAGKTEEALTVLGELEPKAPRSLQTIVRLALASTAELAGKNDVAIKAYEALLVSGPAQEQSFFKARLAALGATPAAK